MQRPGQIEVPLWLFTILNQAFEMERKIEIHGDAAGLVRNLDRLKSAFQDQGLFYENPIGSKFDETRTDVEASISGNSVENLVVVEVLKPIIRYGTSELSRVVQKGIVVVKTATTDTTTEKE
jgi:hypothetical protein